MSLEIFYMNYIYFHMKKSDDNVLQIYNMKKKDKDDDYKQNSNYMNKMKMIVMMKIMKRIYYCFIFHFML